LVTVTIPELVIASGSRFSFTLPRELTDSIGDEVLIVALMDGGGLPNWLQYVASSKGRTKRPDIALVQAP
jgi:hypothetical protein